MEITLPSSCLAVFVDDTGHEALVKGQPVYGLGGCAAMAADLDRLIRNPWREVRRCVTGSADTPLHAAEFARGATPQQIQAVTQFFRTQLFARLGAIITLDTLLSDLLGPVPTIAKVLQQRILHIANWTPFRELAIIFESSERADPLIQAAFQGLGLEENGTPIPVNCYFMPKSAADPALEVADFIMHAVGRQARHGLGGKPSFVLDFVAVFHNIDQKLVSFMNVNRVVANHPQNPVK